MNPIQRSIQHAKKALKYYLNGAAPENNLAVRDLLADVKHYCDAHTIELHRRSRGGTAGQEAENPLDA